MARHELVTPLGDSAMDETHCTAEEAQPQTSKEVGA